MAAYRRGLATAGDEVPGCIAVETVSELHAKLGDACMIKGDFECAAANYKAALRLAPHLVSCWCNLGNVQLRIGKARDAIAFYVQALEAQSGPLGLAHQSGSGADGHADNICWPRRFSWSWPANGRKMPKYIISLAKPPLS